MSGALLAANARPAFARHETFHLRFGWLRKAYTAAREDPHVFTDRSATVTLGVGKNMVHAIRYWAQAYKVLHEVPNPTRPRMPGLAPTAFGRQLLDEATGWDPYLEDPGSLWLLHWQLLAPPCLAPVWWSAFHLFPLQQFEEAQLVDYAVELAAATGWNAVVASSVKKDVDCLLRSFSFRRSGRQTLDDVLDCPTRELGLIAPAAGEARSWRFVAGAKASLAPAVVAYACLDYLTRAGAGERTVSLARLTSDPGSPGRAFRLTETALHDALVAASAEQPSLRVVEPGGLRQLLLTVDPADLRDQVLADYYAVRSDAA